MKCFNLLRIKKEEKGLTIKLDMEQAYDRLEWSFIFKIFEKLGFCEKGGGVGWRIVFLQFSSVLVNGIPGEMFIPSRGIRQGDPLSPYIFILRAEILACQLQNGVFLAPKS